MAGYSTMITARNESELNSVVKNYPSVLESSVIRYTIGRSVGSFTICNRPECINYVGSFTICNWPECINYTFLWNC